MDLVTVFINIFWEVATAFIPLLVPIIVLMLIMKWAQAFLFDRSL